MNDKITKIGSFCGRIILGNYADKIIETATKITDMEKSFDRIEDKLEKFCDKVIKHDGDISGLQAAIYGIGVSRSPMKLRQDFKEILISSDLDEQIEKRKQDIINFIQAENPPTPLDAQRVIDNKARDILKWFDLIDYKNKLYEAGQPAGVEDIIFTVYLYEIIIPELKFPENKK